MAVGTPVSLASGTNGVDATSFATASFTPTANRLVIAVVVNTRSAATAPVPALSGNGISWAPHYVTQGFTTAGTPQRRLTAFFGLASSPTTGVTTIDFAGDTQTECEWSIFEISGTAVGHSAEALAQWNSSAGAGATSDSVSLSGPLRHAGSITVGAWTHSANETTTEGTGYTSIHKVNANSPGQALMTEYIMVPQLAADASWVTSANRAGLVLEIRPPLDTLHFGVPL